MLTIRTPRARALALVSVAAAAALALTGCESSPETPTATSTSTSGSGEATGLAAEVAAALEAPGNVVPSAAVADGDALEGKTVYYVPITLQSAQFNVTAAALTDALDVLGASIQICDGKGTPTDVGSCINQGVTAGAAAIITDAVSYKLGENALDAAQSAGVPVIISNQLEDDAHPASATLGYMATGGFSQQEITAKWVTVDSDGAAHLLANVTADGPAPKAFFAAGQAVYDEECPDCVVVTNEVSTANFSLVSPSTQSALLANSDTDYVQTQFAQFLQPTLGGIQGAGVAGSVKVIAGSVQLGDLKAVADGSVTAATGQGSAFTGWLLADLALRLVAGEDVPEYTIPVRLFTADNIGDVDLTEAAEASGEWYGDTGFPAEFAEIWGR
jgi:ribose transport system substrate-binding protein